MRCDVISVSASLLYRAQMRQRVEAPLQSPISLSSLESAQPQALFSRPRPYTLRPWKPPLSPPRNVHGKKVDLKDVWLAAVSQQQGDVIPLQSVGIARHVSMMYDQIWAQRQATVSRRQRQVTELLEKLHFRPSRCVACVLRRFTRRVATRATRQLPMSPS